MGRLLRFLLVAAAVLFAQHAAQLHAFAHIERNAASANWAGASPAQTGEGECLSLHMLSCAVPASLGVPSIAPTTASSVGARTAPVPRAPRLRFLSRAPPARS